MKCLICKYSMLKEIVDKLLEQQKSYREIVSLLAKNGIHISLGSLHKHVEHTRMEKLSQIQLKFRDLREGEKVLTENEVKELVVSVFQTFYTLEPDMQLKIKSALDEAMKNFPTGQDDITRILEVTTQLDIWNFFDDALKSFPDVRELAKKTYIAKCKELDIPTAIMRIQNE